LNPKNFFFIAVYAKPSGLLTPATAQMSFLKYKLSELLNIDYDNLAAYEAGAERINAKLLFQIAKLLELRRVFSFNNLVTS
jgi:hypothetical protein